MNQRSQGLDVLRSIAILIVMMWHFPKSNGESIFGFLGNHGVWGVDLFFVLSGYLIGNQLLMSKKIPFKNFYLKRALRTLPLYLVVLTLYYSCPVERLGMPPLWKFLTFTQNLDLFWGPFSSAWSLCIEEQFYLFLPLILSVLPQGPRSKIFLIISLIVGGMLLRSWLWDFYIETSHNRTFEYFNKIYYPTWGRLDGLLFGVFAATLKNYYPESWQFLMKKGNLFFISGMTCFFIVVILQGERIARSSVIFGFPLISLSFFLMLLGGISEESLINKLRIPGAYLVATLSYSLYLIHQAIYKISLTFLPRDGMLLNAIFMISMSFVCAFLLHLMIEKPFLNFRHKLDLDDSLPEPV